MRSRAGFCPQCGTPLNPEEAKAAPVIETADAAPAPPAPERGAEALAATAESYAPEETSDAVDEPAARTEAEAAPVLSEERGGQATTVAGEGEAQAQATRRHRVKVAAMDAVEGKIGPRVERLRHASTVVLDEAADDPGLRFVLVAAVLILLSLGLLLLSQILD